MVYALPMSLIEVSGSQDLRGAVTYTVAARLVADPDARFRLRYHPSGWRDDGLSVTVNEDGLLHTATKASARDRGGAVLVQLARAAGAVADAAARTLATPGQTRPRRPAYPFKRVFTVQQVAAGDATLPDGASLSARLFQRSAAIAPGGPVDCAFSLCYRGVVPLLGTISLGGAQENFAVHVVDTSRTEGVDLRGAAFVERKDEMTFAGGLLTTYGVTKPSTAEAVAALPADVLRAFFGAIGELLTIRVKNETAEADLVAQRVRLLQQQALIEAQRKPDASRDAASAPAAAGAGR